MWQRPLDLGWHDLNSRPSPVETVRIVRSTSSADAMSAGRISGDTCTSLAYN